MVSLGRPSSFERENDDKVKQVNPQCHFSSYAIQLFWHQDVGQWSRLKPLL
jgi:hypothetical protein